MNLKLDVVRLANEDVITTSGHDTSKHYVFYFDFVGELTQDESGLWHDGKYVVSQVSGVEYYGRFEYQNPGDVPGDAPESANFKWTNVYIKVGDSYELCEDANHYGVAD